MSQNVDNNNRLMKEDLRYEGEDDSDEQKTKNPFHKKQIPFLSQPAEHWLKMGLVIFPSIFLSLYIFAGQRGLQGNYGQDAPFILVGSMAMAFFFLLLLIPLTLSLSIPKTLKAVLSLMWLIIGMWVFMLSVSLAFGSWDGKFDVIADMTDDLEDEGFFLSPNSLSILDVGCGSGLFSLTLLKRMQSRGTEGKVWCIDVWREKDQFGNTDDNIFRNAEIEGVDPSKLHVLTGDVRDMPPEWTNKFDLVVQSLALHNVEEGEFTKEAKEERVKAINEIVRVTKPEGRILMWDICPGDPKWTGGCAIKEFYEQMEKLQEQRQPLLEEVELDGPIFVFSPSYIVRGRKKDVDYTFQI